MVREVRQPCEFPDGANHIEQFRCAQTIPERVFEAARICAAGSPDASPEQIGERVAVRYGYTDPEARAIFVGTIAMFLIRSRPKPRARGPRWSSPKQVDRGRPGRMVYLSKELHARLDALRAERVNISALAEEALRAHPKVALPPEHDDE